nr:GNAT family N-acetyltransferase [uncultured Oscillibacter sp.]
MEIRAYRPGDGPALAALFYETVHTVNAADYTEEQLDAWAPGTVDLDRWDLSFREHDALLAVEGETILGFGDMDRTGYLDRLYVRADRQREGVASAICAELERRAPGKVVTHASVTARPFFERRGYRTVRRQQVERRGVLLTNFVMEKAAGGGPCK